MLFDTADFVAIEGFPLAWRWTDERYVKMDVPAELRCVLLVPTFGMKTAYARQILPTQVPLKDAVFNLSRTGLAVAAITQRRWDLLDTATQDRLHQPYRLPLFPANALRPGYLRADPRDPAAVERALFDAANLVGEFDKPRFIQFSEGLCAHSRSRITGCTRCLDLCPTGAITAPSSLLATSFRFQARSESSGAWLYGVSYQPSTVDT